MEVMSNLFEQAETARVVQIDSDCSVVNVQQVPFVRASETSRESASKIKPDLARLESVVYEQFKLAGENGMTDEIGCERTGLQGSSYRPRRVKLVELGLVEPWMRGDHPVTRKGKSGRSMQVYRIVEKE